MLPAGPPIVSSTPLLADQAGYRALFARTPYEASPPEIQRNTVLRAQQILTGQGLYAGVLDGLPTPETRDALLHFQARMRLNRTGRLDIDTLAALRLLPVKKVVRPRTPARPYQPTPPGSVRGIRLD